MPIRATRPAVPPPPWLCLDSSPTTFTFDRDGRQLAIGCEDCFVRVLDAGDASVRTRIRLDSPAGMLAFDPPGDVLMVSTEDGAVALYELGSGQRVAELVPASDGGPALAAWIGTGDSLLLGSAEDVREYRYRPTDELIAQNHAYARQRAVVRQLNDRQLAAAWKAATDLRKLDAVLAETAQETVCAVALRDQGQPPQEEWLDELLPRATVATLLRLGHAAYAGGHFAQAREWLRDAFDRTDGQVDAYTALHLAQCDYLAGAYDKAAVQFHRLLERPDLDAAHVPTVQLQEVAALVLADERERARAVAWSIGSLRRDSPHVDAVAVASARDIARFLTGVGSESLLATSVERLLGQFAEGSLRFHDDGSFFSGELARKRKDRQTAAAEYQRCIDLARDEWPANWARFRLLGLSATGS